VARVRTGRSRLGHAEVFALLAALSFLAARFLPLLELRFTCPFRAATGLPCASCGMTHAFVLLARGEFGPALAASPLGAILAAGAWAFALADAARILLGAGWPRVGQDAARGMAVAALAAAGANWAYLLLAARGAP
jgi:hypothetical protein